jgi:hypothetical protein
MTWDATGNRRSFLRRSGLIVGGTIVGGTIRGAGGAA